MSLLKSIISAVSPLVGSELSSMDENQKRAKATQDAQNALNAKSQALAEKMDREGLATTVDANGNINYYDDKTNTWRTILAPQQAQINDASNLELLRSLSIDAPQARGERLRASQSKLLDQGTAGTLRDQLNNTISGAGAQKAGNLASSLRLSREGAVNAGFDQTQTALNTQQLRTGTGVGTAGAQLARARAAAIAQGMGNPDIEGLQLSKDMNATDVSNAINNYRGVADRAYSPADYVPPNPSITPALTSALAASRNASVAGTGNAANIINNVKIPAPITAPNYSQLIASVANLAMGNIGGAASNISSSRTAGNDWSKIDGYGGPG